MAAGKPSYLGIREPSTDRRCRPVLNSPVLFDLTETDESDYDSGAEKDITHSSTGTVASSESRHAVMTLEEALVYLRLRPFPSTNKTLYKVDGSSLIVVDSSSKSRQSEKHFKFTDVFDGSIRQDIIYEKCVHPKIKSEENLTILTYGTSGSGKTFTLLGTADDPGIIPRAFENIFKYYENNIYSIPAVKIENAQLKLLDDSAVEEQEQQREFILANINEVQKTFNQVQRSINQHHNFETKTVTEPTSILIWISFIEIYNENVYDLLSKETVPVGNKRKGLKIITNQGKAFIKNLTSIYVKNSLEAYTVLTNGLKNVSYGSTQINDHSSRSHCICCVDIITYTESGTFSEISYKFCDLAGSERIGKIGNGNTRIKETQQINKSLLVLGRCLDITYQNQLKKSNDIIPHRESKLTMLLHQSLIGKERLTMIVNLMPINEYLDENLNVLYFSSIAKNIVYKTPKKNQNKPRFSWLSRKTDNSEAYKKLVEEITLLRSQNENYSEAYDKLLEENISLRSQNEQLQNQHQQQLIAREIDIRNSLCDEFKRELSETNEYWQKVLVHKEKTLRANFQIQLEKMERSYKQKIEELEEELNELMEDKES